MKRILPGRIIALLSRQLTQRVILRLIALILGNARYEMLMFHGEMSFVSRRLSISVTFITTARRRMHSFPTTAVRRATNSTLFTTRRRLWTFINESTCHVVNHLSQIFIRRAAETFRSAPTIRLKRSFSPVPVLVQA